MPLIHLFRKSLLSSVRFKLTTITPFLALILASLSFLNPAAATSSHTDISISQETDTLWFLIRVDDIYFRSETYGGMDMPHNFTDFQEAVEAYGGRVTWSVIPHRLLEPLNDSGHMTGDLLESVERGHEIAVHGYTHICPLECERSPWGHEMYCPTRNHHFTYREQADLMQNSLNVLRDSLDIKPTSFVAPGHHLDATTYDVLVDLDFFAVSNFRSGVEGTYPRDAREGLVDVPVHSEFTWAINPSDYNSALENALTDIRDRGEADGFYNLMLHDPFIRPGYYDGLVIDWMSDLLDELTTRYGDRIHFITLSEAAEKFRQTQVSSDHPDEQLVERPNRPILRQNYPNPFNPVTVIHYELSDPAQVRLEVFDALGRKIRIMDEGHRESGPHQVRFDAAGLSSGLYLYRLHTPKVTLSRSMLLVR